MKEISNNNISEYIDQFKAVEKSFPSSLTETKNDAIKQFSELGFPTKKNEDWKYTDVSEILKSKFTFSQKTILTRKDIESHIPTGEFLCFLVFENGILNRELSVSYNNNNKLIIGNLKDHLNHPAVKKYFEKAVITKNESFVSLNTAMFNEGAFIYADKNFVSEKPIYLLFINDSRSLPVISYVRNLFVTEKSSSIKISENYFSINSVNNAFTNSVSEIFIGENAHLELCKNESENLNDYHIDYTSVIQDANSDFLINTITSGGKITRNNLNIELHGKNCSARLNGLYVISGDSHVDNHSFVNHASPECYSNELYKGVIDGKAHGVFNGRIYVRRDAQKTNAYQSNKSLLLSDDAVMNSKPQLEIYADDVKCSHGATTGQLDAEAMFYLRSRGIGEQQARTLLTTAFAEEIVNNISIESTRENIKKSIQEKLQKGAG